MTAKLTPEQSLNLARYCCSFYNVKEMIYEMEKKPYHDLSGEEKVMVTKLRIFKELTQPKHAEIVDMVPQVLWQESKNKSPQ